MKIITVSREFGSGGRELGKRLSDELGFAYYDNEIISEIARRTELDENYIRSITEKGIQGFACHFGRSFGFSYDHTAVDILVAQNRVIKELAEKGDCVIVGRGADVILKDKNPLKLFVFADTEHKLERCRKRESAKDMLSDKEMLKKFKEIDGNRRKMYELLYSICWGECHEYSLCVNTSGVEIKTLVPTIAEYAKGWFENKK